MAGGEQDQRRQLRVDLSAQAHNGMHRFARAHGTTVTALLEVLGQRMTDRAATPLAELPDNIQDVVRLAREVDAKRRRRRPEPTPP